MPAVPAAGLTLLLAIALLGALGYVIVLRAAPQIPALSTNSWPPCNSSERLWPPARRAGLDGGVSFFVEFDAEEAETLAHS